MSTTTTKKAKPKDEESVIVDGKRMLLSEFSVSSNLSVGGSLDLSGTQVTSLPDNLSVGGYLDLRGTQVTSLPDNLSVGGSLYLSGTQVTSLPDNLSVGSRYYRLPGSFYRGMGGIYGGGNSAD